MLGCARRSKDECVCRTRMADSRLTRNAADRIVVSEELKSENQAKEMHHVRRYSSLSF